MAEGELDLLSQVQERLLVCEICTERYDTQGRTPRVLPCHHAFCTACLERLGRDRWVRCPSCRRESQVKGAFPKEITRMVLLDLVTQGEASAQCRLPSDLEQERCQPHQKKMKYSCSDCKTFLCSKCAVFLHKGHDVEDLEPLVEQLRKQIEAVSERLQAVMPTFQGRVQRSEVTLKLMGTSQAKAAVRIQAIFSDLVARVQAKERQVLESLQARVEEDRAVLEEEHRGDQTLLKDAEALVEAAQGVASLQGSPSLLMSRVPEMERSCSQLEERAFLPQQSAPAYQVGTGDESAWTAALESFGSILVKPREALADNVAATLDVVQRAYDLVQDALSELEDTLADAAKEDEDREEEEDEADDGDDMKLTEADRLRLAACSGMVKTTQSLLKKTVAAVSKNGRHDSSLELDHLAELVERLSPQVDDLVSCSYPPVSPALLQQGVSQLAVTNSEVLCQLRDSHLTSEDDQKWVEFLLKANEDNREKCVVSLELLEDP